MSRYFMSYEDADSIIKKVDEKLDDKQNLEFTGTTAEWEALTTEQKTAYTIANITDDDGTDNCLKFPDFTNRTQLTELTFSSNSTGEYVYTADEDCWVQTQILNVTSTDLVSGNTIYVNGFRVTYDYSWSSLVPVKAGDVVRFRISLSNTSTQTVADIYKYPMR